MHQGATEMCLLIKENLKNDIILLLWCLIMSLDVKLFCIDEIKNMFMLKSTTHRINDRVLSDSIVQ